MITTDIYKYVFVHLFIFFSFFCVSCVLHEDFFYRQNKSIDIWNNRQQFISQMFYYQIHGNLIYTFNSKKIFTNFIWTQNNKYNYSIKFIDIFGLVLFSICVNNGFISVSGNAMSLNNTFSKHEIQEWLVTNYCFFKQLQQWIIGLPGYNTKFSFDAVGCLSYVYYHYNDNDIFVYYRSHYTNNVPILPKILEISYDVHYIKLMINHWSI